MTTAAELFKVLSVDTRIEIIERLKRGKLCVNALAASLGVTQSAVSQHLRILKSAGLVEAERDGYWIHYSLNRRALERCRKRLERVCTCGCQERISNPKGKSRKKR
ncbi:MAG: ArsR/SmtB family transcription factor [Nitrospinota bacterium]